MKCFKVFLLILLGFYVAGALQTTTQFNLVNKKNYKISYDRDIGGKDIQKISNDLDSLFRYWKNKLKVKHKGKVEFVLYKYDKSYKNKSNVRFNLPIYLNKGSVHISPNALDYRNQAYHSYLSQAVILGILNEVNQKGCPRWLCEAFSVYVAKLKDIDTDSYIDFQHSIKDFQQEYSQLKKETQYKAFMAKTLSFIKFLDSKYGEGKMLLLFRTYDGKKTDQEVFEKVFSDKFDEIEKGWLHFVREKQK